MEGGATTSAGSTAPAAGKSEAASPTPAASPAPAKDREDSRASTTAAERTRKTDIVIVREEFSYASEGRRDPFLSLMKTGELRPMISDLRLVTVVYDPVGRSVAIMRDVATNEQYRVKVGQTLGRMRVTQIRQKEVVFTLDEYGFSRQEVLALNDTTRARSQ
jgi:hypothetical protein